MALQWTNHPILQVPSKEEQIAMGPKRLIEYFERRESAIGREREDPFNFGTELLNRRRADVPHKEAKYLRYFQPVQVGLSNSNSPKPFL